MQFIMDGLCRSPLCHQNGGFVLIGTKSLAAVHLDPVGFGLILVRTTDPRSDCDLESFKARSSPGGMCHAVQQFMVW